MRNINKLWYPLARLLKRNCCSFVGPTGSRANTATLRYRDVVGAAYLRMISSSTFFTTNNAVSLQLSPVLIFSHLTAAARLLSLRCKQGDQASTKFSEDSRAGIPKAVRDWGFQVPSSGESEPGLYRGPPDTLSPRSTPQLLQSLGNPLPPFLNRRSISPHHIPTSNLNRNFKFFHL